ncbi:MAG: O-antigen ligase family protein [bacterium]|nr:O-antigen ligase family protein [bacterium]
MLFVAVGFLSALLGLYQFFTDSFRPFSTQGAAFKAGYIIVAGSSVEPISAALAFFEHPNSLAVYLILALTISLGWWQERNQRILKILVMSTLFAALLSTYAKAEIIAFILIVILYVLSWFIRSPKIFGLIAVGLIGIGVASFWIGMKTIPQYFGTFWWRVDLWDTAVRVIVMNPLILIWGNGNLLFAQNAIWPQPHNLFVDILLKYGVIGLIIFGTIGWILIKYGFMAYRHSMNRQYVIVRAVWMSLLVFGITGLVESSFISIETRMILY